MSTQPVNQSREPLIDVKAAAQQLNLHPHTVMQYAREGKIPCLRFGRLWKFKASKLDEWIDQQLNSSTLPLAPSRENIQ